MRARRRIRSPRVLSLALASVLLITSVSPPTLAAAASEPAPIDQSATAGSIETSPSSNPGAATVATSPASTYALGPTTALAPEAIPPGAVELPERRTENAEHYRMPDGRFVARISPVPIHYRGADGRWEDIDPTLVSDISSGRFRTTSTPLAVSFGAQSADGPVRMAGDGWSVSIDYLGAAEQQPFALGNQARYDIVRGGTDVVYEALDSGVKETILLETASAPNTFDFFVATNGLDFRRTASGRWVLSRPGTFGAELALGDLVVEDSSLGQDGEPARCADATSVVTPVSGGAWVRTTVPREWLSDPARIFPVKVDPSVAPLAYTDTFISSKYATNYAASTELKVGYYDSTTGYNRALVNVDLTSVPAGADIVDAYYHMYQFHTYYASAATTTHLAKITTPWSASTVRWASAPGFQYLESMYYGGRSVHIYWRGANMLATIKQWIANPAANCQRRGVDPLSLTP